jgi:hypothetical protein
MLSKVIRAVEGGAKKSVKLKKLKQSHPLKQQ